MKLRIAIPTLVSGIIALAAGSIFLQTAVSRSHTAEARRVAAEAAARISSQEEKSSATASRQPLSPAQHAEAIDQKVRAAFSVGRLLDQRRAVLAMTKDFTREDFRIAMDSSKNISGSDQAVGFRALLKEWSLRDPLAAMAYASEDMELKETVFRIWNEQDQETAMQWVWQKMAEDAGDQLPGVVLESAAKQDLDRTLEHMDNLDPAQQSSALLRICSSANDEQAAKLVAWANAIEDPVKRTEAAAALFANWNRNSQRKDQQFALLERTPEIADKIDIRQHFSSYGGENPMAARAALEYLSAGQARQEAIRGLLPNLISTGNADAFADVIASYPEDMDEDLLVESIERASYEAPQKALEQVSLIEYAPTRDKTAAIMIERWMDRNAEAATEWLSHNEQSPKVQELIQKITTRRAERAIQRQGNQ